jgi:sulfane dehydrogenase subunit SoxC
MASDSTPEQAAPSFAAPMNPARYQRLNERRPHEVIEPTTPQHQLFVLAHMGIPQPDAAAWRLEITGLVERPQTLTLDDIMRLPVREVQTFHQCAGAPRRPDLAVRRVANVVWRGADLSALLRTSGVRAEAQFLWSYGLDHGRYEDVSAKWYVKDVPLARLAEGGCLLAYAVNGEPLSPEHGHPLRLVIPGYYGTNTVKWLWRLELSEGRATGPFTTVLYNDPDPVTGGTRPVWEAPPESLIVAPAPGPLAVSAIEIWGWAWAAAGVAKTEVSLDGGKSWSPARLEARRQWSWQRFSYDWQPGGPGNFVLTARATDTRGATQPIENARNAIHTVAVTVA